LFKEQNIKDHRYTSVAAFKKDMDQILANSQIFNGPQSAYTMKAHEIVDLTNQLLEKQQGTLNELETNIQRALNANDDGGLGIAH
jgi:transcription initiation factor TFIID subunit 1